MRVFRLIAFLGLAGFCCLPANAEERNFWPVKVEQTASDQSGSGPVMAWQGGGPLFFGRQLADGSSTGGFRPFFIWQKDSAGRLTESDFLYPIFTHRAGEIGSRWSLFNFVNVEKPKEPTDSGGRAFDVWPLYFSRDTGNPATSYHAFFPLHGTIINRLGYDRLSWTLFPLYGRFERRGVVKTAAPWPFVQVVEGDGNHGFALWPLFGRRAKEGVYREQFYLWPLIYKYEAELGQPKPSVDLGVLPFYARDESAGSKSETYVWPFFGYLHRTAPDRYDETRWFWPLFVQGHGDNNRRVDRWAPFYTHSLRKGTDKRWVLWPLFRQEKWEDPGLAQTKTQFLYFLYWSLRQRSTANPALAPAQKTHVWPLFSYWDNGAGHRQLQVLSPLEVFFQDSEPVRLAYSPLFALYRHERLAPNDTRGSLLWDAVTWRRSPARREFHLGPLLSVETGPARRRIALGCGLIGLKRSPEERKWRLFLFDFSSKPDNKAPPAISP
jgi:hypothetical protein